MEDKELNELINKLLKEILTKAVETEAKKHISPSDEHGVYLYKNGEWILYRKEGSPFQLGELGDGVYIIYFDNTKCPACRMYDPTWHIFVEKNQDEAKFLVILCEWFSRRCQSKAASLTFLLYSVKASPTTLFARVEDGEVVDQVNIEGVVDLNTLEKTLMKMMR